VSKANDQDGEPFDEGTKTPPNQEAEVSINKNGDIEEVVAPDEEGSNLKNANQNTDNEGTAIGGDNEAFYEEYIEGGEPEAV